MDEHRKMAEEIVNPYRPWEIIVKDVEVALRTTASKSEKDGWNKAVEECAKIVERGHITIDGVIHPFRLDDIALTLRRLIREEGK
jgi:precorrin-2 methylase